jgi:hypothetical protein
VAAVCGSSPPPGSIAPAAASQDTVERARDISGVHEGTYDPAKHPKGGDPINRGRWSKASGSGTELAAKKTSASPASNTPSQSQTFPVSQQSGSVSPTPISTKTQLPADWRGTWISGTKGNGVFRYNNAIENQQAGIVGKEIRFEA